MRSNLFDSTATFRRYSVEKVSFVLLNQLDLILTVLAISLGLTEVNPWMRILIEAPIPLLIVKVGIPLFIVWLVPGRLLLPGIILLIFVVGWDMKELFLFML